ncbi:hypothetical protein D083_0586 [Dickeya solani RNS 08.23.3.1.A]|nr:hypothetical protein D083_0586 [Dickeya solani RNS 08.23.3.1.A]
MTSESGSRKRLNIGKPPVTKVETRLCDKNYIADMVLRFDGDRQKLESNCLL